MNNQLIEIGKIVKTHGVKGCLVVHFYSEDHENILKYKNFYIKGNQEVKIKFQSKPSKIVTNDVSTNQIKFIVTINNIVDTNQAQSFIGEKIFIKKDEVLKNDNEFFVSDLIGLKVLKYQTKEEIGIVKDIHDFGGGAIIEIKSDIKLYKTFPMFHFDQESFPEVDMINGIVYLAIDPNKIEDLEDEDIEIDDKIIDKMSNSWDEYRRKSL